MVKFYKFVILSFMLFMLSTDALAETITLTWDCDTCAVDGVLGFVLFYGPNSNADQPAPAIVDGIADINNMAPSPYDMAVTINDPDARSFNIDLPKGRWYFRAVVYGQDQVDASKFEVSDFSVEEPLKRARPTHPKNLR